ncbi:MAG: hypothetical protein EOO65_00360 [Methanosarcinales archaeon]|nr:MAG: hypothetical protein EOO65_00360 [Methanosarcinales archaeon]
MARRALLGRLVLRRGLPAVRSSFEQRDECTYYTMLIRAALPQHRCLDIGRVVDIGCRNWAYAPAIAACFPAADLVGIEVDGYRRYWNMYRRIDYARAQAAALPRPAQVVLGDFRDHWPAPPVAGATLLCFFFPFLTPTPCARWGLPHRFADYASLIKHGMRCTAAARTVWLCVHQGDREANLARRMYRDLGLSMRAVKLRPESWKDIKDRDLERERTAPPGQEVRKWEY